MRCRGARTPSPITTCRAISPSGAERREPWRPRTSLRSSWSHTTPRRSGRAVCDRPGCRPPGWRGRSCTTSSCPERSGASAGSWSPVPRRSGAYRPATTSWCTTPDARAAPRSAGTPTAGCSRCDISPARQPNHRLLDCDETSFRETFGAAIMVASSYADRLVGAHPARNRLVAVMRLAVQVLLARRAVRGRWLARGRAVRVGVGAVEEPHAGGTERRAHLARVALDWDGRRRPSAPRSFVLTRRPNRRIRDRFR